MEKYVLVLGANCSIGNEVVKRLIANNYLVFAADRNVENKEFGNLIYLTMDINNQKSIEQAKKVIFKYTPSLYAIIILNNDYFFDSIVEGEEEKLRESFEKNFWRPYRAIKCLWKIVDPVHGRIINDCSDSGLFSILPFNGYYGLSKHLLSNYSDVLRRELTYKGIKVIKIHSGYIKDEKFELKLAEFHELIEKSPNFSTEINRLKPLILGNRDDDLEILDYSNLILKILKKRKPKKVYKIKLNRKLKMINLLSRNSQDRIYKNYGK